MRFSTLQLQYSLSLSPNSLATHSPHFLLPLSFPPFFLSLDERVGSRNASRSSTTRCGRGIERPSTLSLSLSLSHTHSVEIEFGGSHGRSEPDFTISPTALLIGIKELANGIRSFSKLTKVFFCLSRIAGNLHGRKFCCFPTRVSELFTAI